ncbi:acylneuraminate cytidylyltransferase family protein [Adhaeribacter sp. BT258]|uniref:Acylneuraminate cytidylyltransferase family protein n=1 Tax=Adhaeribacter terrigena TaxID=2793070 RepID=A0ABS1BXE8_9BACT|nr:acylneuraminate cytidylyltransferase family protein [Adhaeribacter terrigena]MBK0401708.1 acylneuraminate cytidylyltransferase family protein [Adhaeribacter terrigena]
MKQNRNVLAIIPARGGSKGIPGKNLRLLNGKPLIQYSIDAALESELINKIVVSTDDDKIAEASIGLGAEVIKRPESLAGDKALVIDAIRYTIKESELQGFVPDIIVLLECTSPIKSVEEIDLAIRKLINNEADSVATFKETAVSPNRLWRIEDGKVAPFIESASPFMPRQAQPKGYELTGQVYAFTTYILNQNPEAISILLGRVLPIISKSKAVDIDEELDLLIAEQVLKYIENEKITGAF